MGPPCARQRPVVGFRASVGFLQLLGGLWLVISGITSRLIWVISIVTLLITPLIPTPEAPSRSPYSQRSTTLGSYGGF